MPLIRIAPEALPGQHIGVSQVAVRISGPARESGRRVAPHHDLGAVRAATQCVDPWRGERALADGARRREMRFGTTRPQHVSLVTCIEVEEHARLMTERVLDAGVEMQRTFRLQVTPPTLNTEDGIEIRELTIDPAAAE